ncbi:MAG: PepSY domain-containing protein [Pseudomonadota bacterium]
MKIKVLLIILLISGSNISLADKKPPENALPLSEIILSLETQGYAPIVEVDLDRGVWEIEAYNNGEKRELKVNPTNGDIISDKLDD